MTQFMRGAAGAVVRGHLLTRSSSLHPTQQLTWAVALAGLVALLGGCGSSSLPRVSDELVQSVEGEKVAIVAQEMESNQGDRLLYTYLLLEVTGPGPHLDTVQSTLTSHGWDTREPRNVNAFGEPMKPKVLLLASKPADEPQARLSLLDLDEHLRHGGSRRAIDTFSDVTTDDDHGYFVALLAPLNYR